MKSFEELLEGSSRKHGHLCPGQVIGVRMAMLGLELIGLENPRETREIKKLLVYVEIDRCATDAVSYVTGVTLGRRSLKFVDNGIMAATFLNLETGKAFRILSTEEARDLADRYAPHIEDRRARQLEAYKVMPLSELFRISEVRVRPPVSDMPGPSRFKAVCERCGTTVRDKREIVKDEVLCRACAGLSYYSRIRELEATC